MWRFQGRQTVFIHLNRLVRHCRYCYLISEDSFWSNHFVKDVLTHMSVNSGQRIVQEVNIGLSVDGPGQTHSLLLPTGQVQSLHSTQFWVKGARGFKLDSNSDFLFCTFSPISVASPAGRMSRSGSSAQASSTLWYHSFDFSRPNTMLSWTVAFWIQACWGTYATVPCKKRCQPQH